MGLTSTDATRDASLNLMVAEASDAVVRYLRQNIESQEYTAYLDALPSTELLLPQLPVQASGLQIWVNWSANGDPSLFTSDDLLTNYTDYMLDTAPDDASVSHTGIVRLTGGAWWGVRGQRNGYVLASKIVPVRKAVKVVYTAGYTVVPASITMVVNLITAKLFTMRKLGQPLNSENLNGYGYSVQSSSTANGIIQGDPSIKAALKPFGKQVFVGNYY